MIPRTISSTKGKHLLLPFLRSSSAHTQARYTPLPLPRATGTTTTRCSTLFKTIPTSMVQNEALGRNPWSVHCNFVDTKLKIFCSLLSQVIRNSRLPHRKPVHHAVNLFVPQPFPGGASTSGTARSSLNVRTCCPVRH